jgi:hypothetical protein
VIKVKSTQSKQVYWCPDPSGMKGWVTAPGREPSPAEVFAEGKGSTDRVQEKEVMNTRYDLTSLQKKSFCFEY